jgi:hypothetical protein
MRTSQRLGNLLRPALPCLALVWAVAACGGSTALQAATAGPAEITTDSTSGGARTGSGFGGVAPLPAASAAPSAAAAVGPDMQAPADGNGAVPAVPRDDLKIVYTGSLDLVVDDLQAALAKGRTAVLAAGGYIGASQETNDGDKSVATITYRVPATRWEETVQALRGLGSKVVNEQTQATEVGGQIVDLEARIRNLRASEEVLVGIAKGTGKVTDLLEVQARLSDVRGQIEQLDGQRAQLADQVSYGTLVTTYGTKVAQVQEAAKGWNPANDVDGATATLIGVGQAIASGAIWFGIVWLPGILVLLVLALVARWVFGRLVPARRPSEPVPGWGGGESGGSGEA